MSDEPQQHDEGTPGREPERPADAAPPPSAEGDRSAGRPADPDARPPRRPATGPAGGASDAPGPAARPSGTPGGRPADDKGRSAPPAGTPPKGPARSGGGFFGSPPSGAPGASGGDSARPSGPGAGSSGPGGPGGPGTSRPTGASRPTGSTASGGGTSNPGKPGNPGNPGKPGSPGPAATGSPSGAPGKAARDSGARDSGGTRPQGGSPERPGTPAGPTSGTGAPTGPRTPRGSGPAAGAATTGGPRTPGSTPGNAPTSAPGTPAAHRTPGTPDTRKTPRTPGAPGTPGAQGAPGASRTSGGPGGKSAPGTQGGTGTGKPGTPGAPTGPGRPGTAGGPGKPGGTPGAPSASGRPGTTGAPGKPGATAASGGPRTPKDGTPGWAADEGPAARSARLGAARAGLTQGESPAESTTQLRKHTPKAAAAGAAGTTSAFAATGGPTAPGGPGGSGGGPSGPGGPTGPGGGPAGSGPGDTGGKKGGKAGKGAKGKKAKRPKRKGWRRLVPTWRFTLGSALALLLLAVGAFMTGYLLVEIPAANAAATAQSNVYLYADGSQLARDGEVNRENVQLSQIPEDVQRTVLAAEDRDFHSQSAVDPKAMLRAGWNTATGKGKQSGSTITQQYVKNYYLAQEQTVSRKAKEFFIAIKLDREETKEDILEGYLNTSFFGRNAYGIQSAAQAYYGVDVEKLTIEQGAYLASLLNAPSAYDVVAYPQNKGQVVSRWNYVLDGMVKEGWLASEKREAMKFPMPIEAKGPSGMSGQRGYLVQAVKDYLFEHDIISEEMLNVGGHRITTTLQKPKQDAFVKAVDDQLMARVDKEARKVDRNVRAGGASIDPATGHVVAMYGGIDYTKQYVNNATRRDYQVGSTFKPFVFTTAAEHDSVTQDGRPVTPNTVYDGTSERPVVGWNGGRYAPQNQDQVSYGPVTVQEATDKSVNSVYVQMAVDVGSDKVKQTAIDLGMPKDTRDLHPTPSVALGTATASVLDMAETYATLANHGKHGDPVMVMKLTKDGKEIALPKRQTKQVISREAADTTTSVLRNVVENGSGRAALAAERPAAGKTGTAEQDKAAWFAAYTPELATVVSVMGQDPDSGKQQPLFGALGEPRISGSGPPAEIWAQYTKAALAGTETQEFELRVQDGSDRRLELPGTEPSGTPDSTDGSPDPGSSSPSGDDGEQEQPGGSDTPSTTTGSGSSGGGQSPGQGQSPDPGEGGAEGTVEGQSGGTPGPGATEGTSGDSSGGGPGPGEGGETGGEETGGTGETTGETTGTPTGGASPGLPTTQ